MKNNTPTRATAWVVVFSILLSPIGLSSSAWAKPLLGLPEPGTMVALSPAFQPALIRGLTVHPDNPLLFDFIVDPGQDGLTGPALNTQGQKLIEYFMASLAVPDSDLWVNLSPYERGRTVPEALGRTAMGRDLLAQDYLLKQITASLLYPGQDLGKAFWKKVYTAARRADVALDVPVNAFHKVWIVADKADIFERGQTAFVVGLHLKVMLEEDYLAAANNRPLAGGLPSLPKRTSSSDPASHALRQLILPALEQEVNEGRNFAVLRQISHSLMLAAWYKKNLKTALLNRVYSGRRNVQGIELPEQGLPAKIFERYVQAYKKGVFNVIREAPGIAAGAADVQPRKYFSGGWGAGAILDYKVTEDPAQLSGLAGRPLYDMAMAADFDVGGRGQTLGGSDMRSMADRPLPSGGPLSPGTMSTEGSADIREIQQAVRLAIILPTNDRMSIVFGETTSTGLATLLVMISRYSGLSTTVAQRENGSNVVKAFVNASALDGQTAGGAQRHLTRVLAEMKRRLAAEAGGRAVNRPQRAQSGERSPGSKEDKAFAEAWLNLVQLYSPVPEDDVVGWYLKLIGAGSDDDATLQVRKGLEGFLDTTPKPYAVRERQVAKNDLLRMMGKSASGIASGKVGLKGKAVFTRDLIKLLIGLLEDRRPFYQLVVNADLADAVILLEQHSRQAHVHLFERNTDNSSSPGSITLSVNAEDRGAILQVARQVLKGEWDADRAMSTKQSGRDNAVVLPRRERGQAQPGRPGGGRVDRGTADYPLMMLKWRGVGANGAFGERIGRYLEGRDGRFVPQVKPRDTVTVTLKGGSEVSGTVDGIYGQVLLLKVDDGSSRRISRSELYRIVITNHVWDFDPDYLRGKIATKDIMGTWYWYQNKPVIMHRLVNLGVSVADRFGTQGSAYKPAGSDDWVAEVPCGHDKRMKMVVYWKDERNHRMIPRGAKGFAPVLFARPQSASAASKDFAMAVGTGEGTPVGVRDVIHRARVTWSGDESVLAFGPASLNVLIALRDRVLADRPLKATLKQKGNAYVMHVYRNELGPGGETDPDYLQRVLADLERGLLTPEAAPAAPSGSMTKGTMKKQPPLAQADLDLMVAWLWTLSLGGGSRFSATEAADWFARLLSVPASGAKGRHFRSNAKERLADLLIPGNDPELLHRKRRAQVLMVTMVRRGHYGHGISEQWVNINGKHVRKSHIIRLLRAFMLTGMAGTHKVSLDPSLEPALNALESHVRSVARVDPAYYLRHEALRGGQIEAKYNSEIRVDLVDVLRHVLSGEWDERDMAMAAPAETRRSNVPGAPEMNGALGPEQNPGGIDLTASRTQWSVHREGAGVRMDVDPALIARLEREGVDRLVPCLLRVTPIPNVWAAAGVAPPS